MWTCGSISPGTTVRLPRSIVRMFGTLRGAALPTVMNRPFLIVTARATVLRPSIVWIWPLTSASVSSAVWEAGWAACVGSLCGSFGGGGCGCGANRGGGRSAEELSARDV